MIVFICGHYHIVKMHHGVILSFPLFEYSVMKCPYSAIALKQLQYISSIEW